MYIFYTCDLHNYTSFIISDTPDNIISCSHFWRKMASRNTRRRKASIASIEGPCNPTELGQYDDRLLNSVSPEHRQRFHNNTMHGFLGNTDYSGTDMMTEGVTALLHKQHEAQLPPILFARSCDCGAAQQRILAAQQQHWLPDQPQQVPAPRVEPSQSPHRVSANLAQVAYVYNFLPP